MQLRLLYNKICNRLFRIESKTLKLALNNSMGGIQHFIYLNQLIKRMNLNKLEGAIVECGVWKGGTRMWMVFCQKKYSINRDFYLFDTFEGMTPPDLKKDGQDMYEVYNGVKKSEYSRGYDKWHGANKWAYGPIDLVKENVSSVGYPSNRVQYVVGDVNETLNNTNNIPECICILRLDTDFYDSTKKELIVLYSKVILGGAVIVDDYFSHQGARIAVDEFIEEHSLSKKIEIIDRNITGGKFCFIKNIN